MPIELTIQANNRDDSAESSVGNVVHLPEVFGLKLMAFDAGNNGFLAINGFPINL